MILLDFTANGVKCRKKDSSDFILVEKLFIFHVATEQVVVSCKIESHLSRC